MVAGAHYKLQKLTPGFTGDPACITVQAFIAGITVCETDMPASAIDVLKTFVQFFKQQLSVHCADIYVILQQHNT